jgi:Skp family chaperone for outer membrane proteins
MARKKTVDNLSSDELYALALARQQEEEDAQRHAIRQEIDDLKQQRRELLAKHRKELTAIDAKIKKLGGKTRSKNRSAINVTDAVLAIVQAAGEISTKDIKAELDRQGVVASNLSQTLAYLKRQGRVSSPHRSIYAA